MKTLHYKLGVKGFTTRGDIFGYAHNIFLTGFYFREPVRMPSSQDLMNCNVEDLGFKVPRYAKIHQIKPSERYKKLCEIKPPEKVYNQLKS